MAHWFYLEDGRKVGPVAEAELAQLFGSGRIAPAVSVQAEGEGGWSRLDERLPQITGAPMAAPARILPHAPPNSSWTDTSPHPWRRYFARMIDNALVGTVTWFVLGVLGYSLVPREMAQLQALIAGPGGVFLNILLTIAAALPGNALILGLTGVSVGKWIFGVKVVRPDGRPIGVAAAFGRELQVWVRGLAVGIPFVSLFTLVASYRSLEETRRAPWDRFGERLVVYRPAGLLSTALMTMVVIGWIVLMIESRAHAVHG
jgi:uncharacterized RDD family membrane protein YckC